MPAPLFSLTSLPVLGVLTPILMAGVFYDLREHRIPNALVLAGLAAGLAVNTWAGGLPGFLDAFAGALVLLLLGFPLFALGWLGAGDVKLLAAVGSVVTWHLALAVLVGVGLAGGVLGVLALVWRAGVRESWQRLGLSLAVRRPVPASPGAAGAAQLPYAVAIAAGTLGALYLAPSVPGLVL
ncbi:MAG: prepilin peptidase [Thiohalorhabdus sp.]|uniref:prepilin peptidase n=1 Tax=Thiohalorhabdus sp. TaxID=3094134 RepID=UPI0039815EBD